jgi:hypothetical protein
MRVVLGVHMFMGRLRHRMAHLYRLRIDTRYCIYIWKPVSCVLKVQVSVIVIYRSIGSLARSFELCLGLTSRLRLDDIESES